MTKNKKLPNKDSFVLGDTPYDVIAAARAGIQAIGLLSGGFAEKDFREAGAVEIYKDVADSLEHYGESVFGKPRVTAAKS